MDREVTLARSALARAHMVIGGREPDPVLLAKLKRELEVAKLVAHVRKLTTDSPLTGEELQRLALMLRGGEPA